MDICGLTDNLVKPGAKQLSSVSLRPKRPRVGFRQIMQSKKILFRVATKILLVGLVKEHYFNSGWGRTGQKASKSLKTFTATMILFIFR